jgi:hypothetical protein
MVLQGLAAGVVRLAVLVHFFLPAAAGGRGIEIIRRFPARFHLRRGRLLPRAVRGLAGAVGAGLGPFLGFEHDVAVQGLACLGDQLERRKLQQAYGLLQLGSHGQFLADLELKGGLKHLF